MEDNTMFSRTLDGGKITVDNGDVTVELPGLPKDEELEAFKEFIASCDFPEWNNDLPCSFTPDPAVCHLLRLGDCNSHVSTIRLFIQYVGPVTLYYAREIKDGQVCDLLSTPVVRLESGRGPTKAKQGDVTFFYAFIFQSPRKKDEEEKRKLKSMFSDLNRRHYSIQIDIECADTGYRFSSKILVPGSGAVMKIQLPATDEVYPQSKAEWDAGDVVSLLVASPQVQNAIFKLSEAWTNPTVQTILLTAPPGAGKEEYVKFLRAGFGTLSKGNSEEALPLPGKKPEQVEEYIRERVSQWDESQVEKKRRKGDGALSVLFGNTPVIFLDESDKAEHEVRDALLRVLSARKLPRSGEHKQVELKEDVFVFTASTIYSDLLARVEPRDFWTRVQLTVESAHPLMIGAADDRLWIVQQYVRMFLERNLVKNRRIKELARNLYGSGASEAVSQLQERSDKLAEQIAIPLSRLCQIRIPSIRVVRTITDKIVWNMLAQGLGGTGQNDGEATKWSPRSPFDTKFKLNLESSQKWCDEYVPIYFLECFA